MKERISELRNVLGLSQREFGEKIGMSRDAIASYEYKHANPTGPALVAIEKVYGVRHEWLLTGEGEMFEPGRQENKVVRAMMETHENDQTFRAIVDAYLRLGDRDRKAIRRYIDLLAQSIAEGESPVRVDPTQAELEARVVYPGDDLDSNAAGE